MSNTPPFDLVAIHGLAPGWEDQWWVLYELLESRMHDVIMSGPRNDPDHWTVAGPFKSILRDANTAQDFMAELLLGMLDLLLERVGGPALNPFSAPLLPPPCGSCRARWLMLPTRNVHGSCVRIGRQGISVPPKESIC